MIGYLEDSMLRRDYQIWVVSRKEGEECAKTKDTDLAGHHFVNYGGIQGWYILHQGRSLITDFRLPGIFT